MRTSFSNGTITIRPFEPKDVLSFFSAVRSSIQTLKPWMPLCHPDYSMMEAETWLAACQNEWCEGTSYPFLIIESESGTVLGGAGINQINRPHNFGNIGYWVAASHTRKGIATAAVKMLTHFGFSEAGFTRLEIVALTENTASRRVAEKSGATFECIARNRIVGWGKPHDAAIYSLTPDDVPG